MSTIPRRSKIPRRDVGAAGISGVLATVIAEVISGGLPFDFHAWEALLFGLLTALAGYASVRYKNLIMVVAASASTIAAYVIGVVAFHTHALDAQALSVAISTFTVAFVGWVTTAFDPTDPTNAPPPPEMRRRAG